LWCRQRGIPLDDFLAQVNLIRQRQATEAALLDTIRRRLPAKQRRRLDELRGKLEAETLTDAERTKLLELVERVEAADVERAEALLALAQKRGVSVRQLMDDHTTSDPALSVESFSLPPPGPSRALPIHLSTMSYPCHSNQPYVVLDFVNHTI